MVEDTPKILLQKFVMVLGIYVLLRLIEIKNLMRNDITEVIRTKSEIVKTVQGEITKAVRYLVVAKLLGKKNHAYYYRA